MSVCDNMSSSQLLGNESSLLSIKNECKGSLQQQMSKQNTKIAGAAQHHTPALGKVDEQCKVLSCRMR